MPGVTHWSSGGCGRRPGPLDVKIAVEIILWTCSAPGLGVGLDAILRAPASDHGGLWLTHRYRSQYRTQRNKFVLFFCNLTSRVQKELMPHFPSSTVGMAPVPTHGHLLWQNKLVMWLALDPSLAAETNENGMMSKCSLGCR